VSQENLGRRQSRLRTGGNLQKVILIDGARLAELMSEHNIGVSVASTIQFKKIDTDYFEDV
jgi:restriction endonuclease Mrr